MMMIISAALIIFFSAFVLKFVVTCFCISIQVLLLPIVSHETRTCMFSISLNFLNSKETRSQRCVTNKKYKSATQQAYHSIRQFGPKNFSIFLRT
jgi:hypothetical protein